MAGSIWRLTNLAEEGAISSPGDQTRFDEAKALVESLGGLLQVGPPLAETLLLGAFLGTKTALVLVTADGRYIVTGLRLADSVDPTKLAFLDPSGIATGTQRVITLPDWSGLLPLPVDSGALDQFLRSGGVGVQPAWVANPAINALLDGANHSDTLAGSVVAGDLLFGNATPKWARLPKGSDGQALVLVSGLPAWSAIPSASHDVLAHIKAIRATGCGVVNGTNRLTTSGGQFANVRVGDRVLLDAATTSLWGASVSGLVDSNNLDLDLTNTGSTISGKVAVITPGDHFNSAITESNGYLMVCGRGTFDAAATPGGSFESIRGSKDFLGYESSAAPRIGIVASTSTATPFGFNWLHPTLGHRAYVHVNDLTGNVVLRLGNPASGDFFVYESLAQDLLSKRLKTVCKIVTDGTATYTVFQSAALVDRLGLDLSAMTALRAVSFPDYAGRARIEGAPVTFANADTTPSVLGSRVFLTNNAGATSITTFDDAVNGQEITVIAGDNNTTIVAGANMKTPGGLNVVLTTDDVARLVKSGATWYVQTVSVNA